MICIEKKCSEMTKMIHESRSVQTSTEKVHQNVKRTIVRTKHLGSLLSKEIDETQMSDVVGAS